MIAGAIFDIDSFPGGIYMFKVNNQNTRTTCEIYYYLYC